MASGDRLEELRRVNKSLLQRLTIRQSEMRRRLCPSVLPGRRVTQDGAEEAALDGFGDSLRLEAELLTSHGSSSAARQALCTPRKTGRIAGNVENPSPPGDPSSHMTSGHDVIRIRSPVKRLNVLNSAAVAHHADAAESSGECSRYIERLLGEGNIRSKEPRTPKSILLTPNRSPKRDPGRVTFLSAEPSPPPDRRSTRALLGYDWIAGLLEVDSPVTNKSDQFFSEIGEFRRVNREECARECFLQSETQESSEDELDLSLDTHQCVYCYRVNHRLFTTPVGAEPACPICKKRRSRRHVALDEPAYIRVSIPRSMLLPPYKYRAHRRKSFDPTDSFALPSHCLAGWENAKPSCDLRVTSLDLKTSLDPNTATTGKATDTDMLQDSASYFASRARSENLLNMSRSIGFHNKCK